MSTSANSIFDHATRTLARIDERLYRRRHNPDVGDSWDFLGYLVPHVPGGDVDVPPECEDDLAEILDVYRDSLRAGQAERAEVDHIPFCTAFSWRI